VKLAVIGLTILADVWILSLRKITTTITTSSSEEEIIMVVVNLSH
jgi:hypothetical protein